MDESNAIRAITVGVSTFIAVITISAVMMYYGVAKETAQAIGQGEDIAGNYTNYILDLLLYNKKTDGTGVKNILNYFYLNERVSVDIRTMTNLGSVKNTLANNVTQTNNVTNVNNNVSLYNSIIPKIISTQTFNLNVEYYDVGKTEIKKIIITEI